MIRLNITAEGFSEERFVADILRPHLLHFGIYADVRKVLTNKKLKKRGGIVGFEKFRNDVMQWIKESPDAYHTTLIDLYGLRTDFPGYATTKHLHPITRIRSMEEQLGHAIGFHRFIPYIQLHEYEALLFSDPQKMEEWLGVFNDFPPETFHAIRESVDNPELINDSPHTAPSKRILSVCENYDKVDDGILILKEIGLTKLREECPHFNEWLTGLEALK